MNSKASGVLAAVLLFGVGVSTLAVRSGWGRDFASFYHSAAALDRGADPYRSVEFDAAVNINLPHATALLIPLSLLTLPVAFAFWQVAQLTAWWLLLRRLLRAYSWLPRAEFAAGAVLFPGTLAQLAQGQWAFLLAWLIAMAWFAHRRGAEGVTGIWLGVAAALKPFVALLLVSELVRGRVRCAVVGAVTAGTFFAAGAILFGPTPYAQWFTAIGQIDWAGYASNASVRGLFERSLPGAIAPMWPVAAALVAIASVVTAARCEEDDACAWTVVLAGALLTAPLGWLYYAWMLVPSLFALSRWPPALKAGLVILWIPPGFAPTLSTATVGLLMLWSAFLIDRRRRRRSHLEPVASGSYPA